MCRVNARLESLCPCAMSVIPVMPVRILRSQQSRQSQQRGVAMIMVLWMIVVMMSMTATLLYAVKTETQMVSFSRESAQARAVSDAAAHYTVMQLFLPPDEREISVGGGVTPKPLVLSTEDTIVDIIVAHRLVWILHGASRLYDRARKTRTRAGDLQQEPM